MLDDASLLLAWERGYGRAPFEQALVLLKATSPGATEEMLMNLSIGKRDAALLRARSALFGPDLETLANCPECEQVLELKLGVDDIMLDDAGGTEPYQAVLGNYQVDYRLPTSRDLALLTRVTPSKRADQLLELCVTRVRQADQPVELTQMSDSILQQLSEVVADSDPQADIQLDLTCAGCGHRWSSPFDIVVFLWTELNAWCQRLLAEIHVLAKAYGWTEREILALSRWRRQVYLGMVRQ